MNRADRWRLLTNHGRVLLFIAMEPGVRLRDIAGALNVTERTVHGIVGELTEAGYLVKEKDKDDGRRNRYRIKKHLPWRETIGRNRTIGEILNFLVNPSAGKESRQRLARSR